jgi:hypothetical protein
MLLSEELYGYLEASYEDEEWEDRMGSLRADLEAFVTEEDIYPRYLFLLYPTSEGVWEIRSMRPNPSIRVLGLFPCKDVFVATHYTTRDLLGGWQSRQWKDTKRMARTKWRNLYQVSSPHNHKRG